MSKEDAGIRAAKITLGQLLLIDIHAYVNLALMFPHDARTTEEIPALILPDNYMLVLTERRELYLISKTPSAIKRFDKKSLEWVAM
jgi:hypothetical protein